MAERQHRRRRVEVEQQQQRQCRSRSHIPCRPGQESNRACGRKQAGNPIRRKRKETTDVVYRGGRDAAGNRSAKTLEQEGD